MKKKLHFTLLLAVLFVCTLNAQIAPPGPPPPPPPGLSIDGGIFLLILSGLIYGVKKNNE